MEKKSKSLTGIMMRSIAVVAAFAICLALIILLMINVLIARGILLPANASESYLPQQEQLLKEDFRTSNIAYYYNYALFDESGSVLQTNMSKKMLDTAHTKMQEGGNAQQLGNQFRVIEHEKQVLVLHYSLQGTYGSEWMQRHLPAWDILMVLLWVFLLALFCLQISRQFAKQIHRNLQPILDTTAKIAQQDLAFDIMPSSIKEFNLVNDALSHMKDALQTSLESKWHYEAVKNRQMAAIAHDIKTPLTIILSRAQLLAETASSEKCKDGLLRMEASAQQIEYLVECLMETSLDKPIEVTFRLASLAEFLTKLATEAEALAQTKGQTFTARINITAESLMLDSALLERAIMNIVDNAVSYAPEGACIYLTASIADNNVMIDILNTGSFFSDDVLQNGTELFYRGEKARSISGHYGFGLHNSSEIMKAHGGTIHLCNKTDGACVRLIWPLQQ